MAGRIYLIVVYGCSGLYPAYLDNAAGKGSSEKNKKKRPKNKQNKKEKKNEQKDTGKQEPGSTWLTETAHFF